MRKAGENTIDFNIFSNGTRVHKVLAYSYSLYFLFFLLSVYLDFVFPIKIFDESVMAPLGVAFLTWATFLIFWAQRSSRRLDKANEGISKESFRQGPYCYTRTPTHWGLFFLLLGFGLVANAFFIIMFTVFSFIISKLAFLKKQEKMLEQKYGAPYLEYKKIVKF